MKTKDVIKTNFSRYAAYYDAHSTVQDRAGAKLLAGLDAEGFGKILDIGCGTGNYTGRLRDKFGEAEITAVDISGEMIEIAKHKLPNAKINFIVADGETAQFDDSFDLITSNACFQWFGNMSRAVTNYKKLLNEGGTISFSMFGPQTFCELRESLGQLYKKDVTISSSAFIDIDRLSEILEENFDSVSIDEQICKETYNSLWDLLSAIKYTGTQGFGVNGGSISKRQIAQLEQIYKERFKDITATYQIFYCAAK